MRLVTNPEEFPELQQYKQDIGQGKYVIGNWMKLNLQFVEDGLKEKKWFYCPEKAQMAINFIESQVVFVAHRSGHFILENWQKYIIACIYGLVDEDFNRHFSKIVWIVGRKQGKSATCGAIEAYHAFSQKQPGMQLYNLAPKLKQANIIYSQFLAIVDANKSMKAKGRKRRDDYYIKEKNCTVAPLAFNSKKSDGFDPAFTVFDEFAAWEGAKSLDMNNVILSAQGAQAQPVNIFCSTANFVDDGLYDELFPRCTRVLMGESEEDGLLPFLYMIDDLNKWDDPEELKKALPNLGVSFLEKNLLKEIKTAKESNSYRAEFITKYCNIKQNSTQSWLNAEDIRATQGEKLLPERFRGMYCTGGADLSRTTDLTAACLSIDVGGHTYLLCHFWLPAKAIKEAQERDNENYQLMIQLGFLSPSGTRVIDYHDVTQWFVAMRDTYGIMPVVIGYDRYSAEYWVNDMREHGFEMDDVNQGTNLTPILYNFEGKIKSHTVHTGTNGLLQSHFKNSAIQRATAEQGADKRVRLVKYKAEKHIDGMAAVIDAETVKDKWSDKYRWLFDGNTFEPKGEVDELADEAFSLF